MNEPNGLYYGVNATSRNLVILNRMEAQNSNGLIIGKSGSGKNFAAKMEMAQAFLKSESNEIFVIDPQAEYRSLCEALGGQVIRIAPGSDTHINPFDMDLDYASNGDRTGDDPVTVKSDYISALCKAAVGGNYGLNPVQESVIDRCMRMIYAPCIEHMDNLGHAGSTVTCDHDRTPTLKDFYDVLRRQPEPDVDYIRIAMEKYCEGSYDTFAYKTNVDTDRRFITYDISDIGTGIKEMGMQVCLEDIWNRTVANRKRKIRTRIFIDEFYLLTQSDADRKEIGSILHISEAQMDFIKNAQSGHGLIWYGGALLPFGNDFPAENRMFRLLSTKPPDADSRRRRDIC